MKALHIFPAIALIGCLIFPYSVSAATDPAASVVMLRKSCNDGAGGTLNNCFTATNTLLDWVWNTRNPTATAPLLIDIGPGTFGSLSCPLGKGFVTFHGSGRGRTIFSGASTPLDSGGRFEGCNQLVFEHLTISGRFIGVIWAGGGSSNWTDVEMLGSYSAWYDSVDLTSGNPCPGREGTHRIFGSTMKVTTTGGEIGGGKLFLNSCGKNWIYASELLLDAPATSPSSSEFPGIISAGIGNEVHLYGSNLRLFSGAGSTLQSMTAIAASNGAEVHVHGTGIDVIATKPINVIALSAGSGGMVHANESAYNMQTGAGGTITRIVNSGGHVNAPYIWEHIPTAPLISLTGADMTTVTTGTSDGHPHLVIYDTSCISKWYDVVDRACRP